VQLAECLERCTWRRLYAIARAHGLPLPRQPGKADLAGLLLPRLASLSVWQLLLRELPPEEMAALQALAQAGGRMSPTTFARRFGAIRPYRPWKGEPEPHPWRHPVSAAERLWYLGLIYRNRGPLDSWEEEYVVIPAEFLARLPGVSSPGSMAVEESALPADAGNLLYDVAAFLIYLNCHDLRPRHGRWLTPRHVLALNRRLTRPEDLGEVRGERGTGRLCFIHYLAEAAGLVALAGGFLKPAPGALPWLKLGPADRRQALWLAWTGSNSENDALWIAYRLPGWWVSRPTSLFLRLLERLGKCPPGRAISVGDFVAAALEEDDEFAAMEMWRGQEIGEEQRSGEEFLRRLLTSYLPWMGAIALGNDGAGHFCVTPRGAWLLGLAPLPEPDDAAGGDYLDLDGDLTVRVPAGFAPDLLYRLGPWLEFQALGRYSLTRAGVIRALGRGGVIHDLLQALEQGLGRPLPGFVSAPLWTWALESSRLTIRRVTVLEAADRRVLAELTSVRRIRDCLRESFSPRAVAVDPAALPRLVRALRRQGHEPLVKVSPAEEVRAAKAPGPGGAAHLLLAARVFNGLARFIEPAGRIPSAVLEEMEGQVPPAGLEVVERLAEETLERLAQALDGWSAHGAYQPVQPLEQTIQVVEEAIAAGSSLEILYFTAGRGELSRRVVDPYRVEQRRGVPYLVGYCHLRQAERVFRLNRIREIKIQCIDRTS
jgi:hypothetical protein